MFPSYLQPDSMDCGPACLRIISKFYGKNYSMLTLRDRCYMSREGVSLLDLSDAAESLGFRTTGISTTWEVFRDEVPLPCIVYWNSKHYVVVYKIRKRRGKWWVYVSDPAVGLLKYDEEKFLRGWLKTQVYDDETDESRAGKQGVILLLEPTPRFYESPGEENTQLKFSYLLQYLKPYKSYFVQLVLAMLVASGLNLILPFLTQSIVDVGIGTGNLNFVVMILIAQVALTLGQFANNLIRQWLSLHMTTRISISYISDFLCKLMRLPIAYFDAKKSGDILQRIGDYGRVQSFLTGTLLSMAVAILTFIVYTCVMAGYSATILLVFLGGSILYALWVLLFMKYRRKLDYMRFQESSENQSTMIQLIGGMQDIKLNSCERQKRWEWERIQARLFKISIKSLTLGQTQEVGALFISQTKNIVVSFLAVSAVIKGDMTLGMMMAMQYILGQLNGPLSQFISFMQATQDAKISLERLGEIYDRPDEEPDDEPRIRTIPDSAPLEFRDVVFHYEGPNSERAGRSVADDPRAQGDGHRRGVGQRQDDDAQAAAGLLPPHAGRGATRRPAARTVQRKLLAPRLRRGDAGGDDLCRHHRPQYRRRGRTARHGACAACGAHGQHRRVDRVAADALRHEDRTGRPRPEHGTAAASVHRARGVQGCEIPLSGRGDQLAGCGQRTLDHGEAAIFLRGAHGGRRGAPPVDGDECRQHRGARPGPHRRAGHAQGADGAPWPLLQSG